METAQPIDDITYDPSGRMQCHPEFHPNQSKPFAIEDLVYLCKFVEMDGIQSMGMALGRTSTSISNMVAALKRNKLFEHYKKMERHWRNEVDCEKAELETSNTRAVDGDRL